MLSPGSAKMLTSTAVLCSMTDYWSTACIIGRVLAAGKDVSDCINWLTSPVTPEGMTEGWVNVQVELEPRSGKLRTIVC